MNIVHSDRRSSRRYPIRLALRYVLLRDEGSLQFGTGTTVDMSSRGMAFRCSEPVPAGSLVQLTIFWPVEVPNASALMLRILGKIVRGDSEISAVRISRYEFAKSDPGVTSELFEVSPGRKRGRNSRVPKSEPITDGK